MRFVDLFAGLGGFHQALHALGHECVFASELDDTLADTYEKNFGIRPKGDIRDCYESVPEHDILCAGFPCQPFSKAGDQKGFDCPQWGDLFDYVIKILDWRKPTYLMIENVPNLIRHDGGKTWEKVQERLRNVGYEIDVSKLSPHMFGVPQIRERAIIVGSRSGLSSFEWPVATHSANDLDIKEILDERPVEAKPLGAGFVKYLDVWQELLDALPVDEDLPSFPIWAMEFGATYPYLVKTPVGSGLKTLGSKRGSFGTSLRGLSEEQILATLPPYARGGASEFPAWKVEFIRQNRAFYRRNRDVIDEWLPRIRSFAPSFQKLEWNWKGGPRDLSRCLIQFRASGIRAKRPTVAPSLVALTTSQVPVIPWEARYMTMRECARLQSMGALKHLPASETAAYRALGNAVNVSVIKAVAEQLLAPPPAACGSGESNEERSEGECLEAA